MAPLLIPVIGSIVRHLLTAGGGAAMGAAATAPDGSDAQVLAGALATIIGFVLSWLDKRKRAA